MLFLVMEEEEHSFYNYEIKPALVVINIFIGLFTPFTTILGVLVFLVRPVQAYFGMGGSVVRSIVFALVGIVFPVLMIWSIITTWRHYRRKNYRKAFYVSISPFVFALLALALFVLVAFGEWIADLF